jgi:hypothetical protein
MNASQNKHTKASRLRVLCASSIVLASAFCKWLGLQWTERFGRGNIYQPGPVCEFMETIDPAGDRRMSEGDMNLRWKESVVLLGEILYDREESDSCRAGSPGR